MPAPFDDLQIGMVAHFGATVVEERALQAFIEAFAPGWSVEQGAPGLRVQPACDSRQSPAPPR